MSSSIKNAIIGERYRLVQKIGQGSFGKVYSAFDMDRDNNMVAVKTEPLNQSFSHLIKEI